MVKGSTAPRPSDNDNDDWWIDEKEGGGAQREEGPGAWGLDYATNPGEAGR